LLIYCQAGLFMSDIINYSVLGDATVKTRSQEIVDPVFSLLSDCIANALQTQRQNSVAAAPLSYQTLLPNVIESMFPNAQVVSKTPATFFHPQIDTSQQNGGLSASLIASLLNGNGLNL